MGNDGLRKLMVLSDSDMRVRGTVGNASFSLPPDPTASEVSMQSLLGTLGQIQVVRNHPMWKNSMNGITQLREASIATNMALYLQVTTDPLSSVSPSV